MGTDAVRRSWGQAPGIQVEATYIGFNIFYDRRIMKTITENKIGGGKNILAKVEPKHIIIQ